MPFRASGRAAIAVRFFALAVVLTAPACGSPAVTDVAPVRPDTRDARPSSDVAATGDVASSPVPRPDGGMASDGGSGSGGSATDTRPGTPPDASLDVKSDTKVEPMVDGNGTDPRVDANGTPGPIALNALQVGGTHNSYHVAPLVAFHASHKYTHLTLDKQLAGGLRALELDVHLGDDGVFDVYHIAVIDQRATCTTFEACLRTVATWSDANRRHTPIFIWIEIKDDTGGSPIDDPEKLEETILRVFPRDRLITPDSLRGTYASPRERIMKAGWPHVDDVRGKIVFSVLNRDDRARVYTRDFKSLDGRLMFVSAAADQFDMPWAAFTEANPDDQPLIARAHAARLLTTTNVCAIDRSDDDCRQRLASALTAGVHMLKDDLPFVASGRAYTLALPKGSPGCNPVTAPPNCFTAVLE
jgi:hypothetical protein